MKEKRNRHKILLVLLDALAAGTAWALFFAYRKFFIEPDKFGTSVPFELDKNFFLGLCYVPLYWVLLYYLAGQYKEVWRRSRIKEVSKTFSIAVLGVVLLFFALLLDDEVKSYQSYYRTTLTLFLLHFSITLLCRLLADTYIISRLRKRAFGYHTLVIGNNKITAELATELLHDTSAQGFILKGYVSPAPNGNHVLKELLPHLGYYSEISEIIKQQEIEEIIIGIESSSHQELNTLTNLLEDEQVTLRIIPDLFDMRSGSVRLNNVIGSALIEINHDVMPPWQKVLKRVIDVVASVLVFLVFSPVFLAVAIAVKLSSKGPVLFKQIRIGFKGKPFHIHKFRSMYVDAETDGPALSKKDDKRITPVGRILRKYRFDELPQFYNVLIGEMSLVGPRPERKYFIDQIVKVAPHYKHLQRVKPGITSWGQVKYGYAENVEQMIERLKFDILYIENRSIAVDLRILIYTIMIILQGRGK